jgi:hypothetical protein
MIQTNIMVMIQDCSLVSVVLAAVLAALIVTVVIVATVVLAVLAALVVSAALIAAVTDAVDIAAEVAVIAVVVAVTGKATPEEDRIKILQPLHVSVEAILIVIKHMGQSALHRMIVMITKENWVRRD